MQWLYTQNLWAVISYAVYTHEEIITFIVIIGYFNLLTISASICRLT